MAIIPRKVDGAFDAAVFDFLASHDGLVPQVYSDGRGIPTLGISYAMLANTPGWPPCETLEHDLEAIGITLTPRDRLLLLHIGEALSCQDLDGVRALVPARNWNGAQAPASRFSFTVSRAQAQALFERNRPDVEVQLQHKLGRALMLRLADSWELVALFSLAYDNPALIGPGLVDALESGARAEVWYEIRFGTNSGRHPRLQRRRNRESARFGLVNDAFGEPERHAIGSLLDDKRPVIKRYLMDLGHGEADAQQRIVRLYRATGLNLPPCLRAAGAALELAAGAPQARRDDPVVHDG